jgi:predicted HAD superfamily Cof-like phosphohydrolase
MLLRQKACNDRWVQSDHGRLVKQMHAAARNTALRAIKKEMDLETTIQSLGDLSAGEVAQPAMNTPRSKMHSITVLDYATNVGAVYIFYTELDYEDGVEFESLRFIIQGQESFHEAVPQQHLSVQSAIRSGVRANHQGGLFYSWH